ncbi:SIR2 family protein [Curvibacter sp. RS43]|uniref:SIR2 family protein n=1 Tax=Curvibacter microcysteis TaxID=3026419 RepID=UPI0023614C2A|nr:SIR2 family protein [Curvibacter sp. RS43]MDD0811998.1 SIR2 family protein [Curvibacter sp. RS43]
MIEKLNPQQFKAMEVDIPSLVETIAGGKAILFVGSGFARNAIALDGSKFPTAEVLARNIGTLGGFDSDDDLRYASEKYIRSNPADKLVQMLLDTFTVKEVLPHQVVISTAPWRRIYTTNYDLVIEEAAKKGGLRIDPTDLDDSPRDCLAKKTICVHLNGSIQNLRAEDLNGRFKLSLSSYLSPETFTNSDWHFPFKRDLEMCTALIFVGYSLYDIEIQKILYENPDFSQKTFFITSPAVSERERFTLAPFGNCIPIGAESFAEKISNYLPKFEIERSEATLTSFKKYEISEVNKISRDADAERFLMFGDIGDAMLEASLLVGDGAPLAVRRTDVNIAADSATKGSHIAVISEFGNGKSIFLRSLAIILAQKGGDVYIVDTPDDYNREDLEIIAKSGKRAYLVIDSYDQHGGLLQHFSDLDPSNVTLLVAARTAKHERMHETLSKLKINMQEFVIDELDNSEVEKLVEIIDNVGLWAELVTLGADAKANLIKGKHRKQLQQTLLSILQAPQMVTRVTEIVKSVFIKNTYKDTIFAISVLSALDFPLRPSLISEVAGNDEIYSSALRNNEDFRSLVRIERGLVYSRSSIFSLVLIRNNFVSTYIVDQLLMIAKRMDDNQSDNQYHDVLKALLRFSGVERLFPERQRINNLVRFYEEVKRRISWLKQDPHYWLQFGMALLAHDDYPKSQRMLTQAYEWAKKKNNYHTMHIDMQQSRLYMKMSAKETDTTLSFKYFTKGVEFLRLVSDDVTKFSYLENLNPIYLAKFEDFNRGQKIEFIKVCKKLLQEMLKFIDGESGSYGVERRLSESRAKIEKMVNDGSEIIEKAA